MRTYDQLNAEEKKQAMEKAAALVLTDIIEHGMRFNDALNGDGLQSRIDKAVEKADKMQTPWFVAEYIMASCRADIEAMAQCDAADACYPDKGETVIRL